MKSDAAASGGAVTLKTYFIVKFLPNQTLTALTVSTSMKDRKCFPLTLLNESHGSQCDRKCNKESTEVISRLESFHIQPWSIPALNHTFNGEKAFWSLSTPDSPDELENEHFVRFTRAGKKLNIKCCEYGVNMENLLRVFQRNSANLTMQVNNG